MNLLTIFLLIAVLLGSALIGGVFFSFSSFIMKALAQVSPQAGIAAMQSINVVVINRSFLGAFMGTAAVSIIFVVLGVINWGMPAALWLIAGALTYLVGTFLVTLLGNVPLNDKLAAVAADDAAALAVWQHYLERWTLLNTIRATAAMVAALLFAVALMRV